MSRRWVAIGAAAVLCVSTTHASAERLRVVKTQLCLVVHNPGGQVAPGGPSLPADPVPRRVVAQRFETSQVDRSKVVLLVHGHSWWQNEWDLHPDFSIARNLARQGYLVISYDRLGNGASTYPLPMRDTLTFPGQQEMLHEVVAQLRGTSVLGPAEVNPCGGVKAVGATHDAKVALVGHSQGALLVNGYPGRYGGTGPGRIDALIEDGNGACAAGAPCPLPGLGARATTIIVKKLAANAGRDFSLGLTDGSYDPYLAWQPKLKAIDPVSCSDNTFGMLWPEATSADALVDEACDPANQETVPFPEFVSAAAIKDDLRAADARLPVLLVFADHDGLRPGRGNPDAVTCNPDPFHDVGCQQPLVDQWRSSCPCRSHVTSWILRNAGHSVALDRSMPSYTNEVGWWLRHNGFIPRR